MILVFVLIFLIVTLQQERGGYLIIIPTYIFESRTIILNCYSHPLKRFVYNNNNSLSNRVYLYISFSYKTIKKVLRTSYHYFLKKLLDLIPNQVNNMHAGKINLILKCKFIKPLDLDNELEAAL